ncbi:helix-turn-helix domain-containing protein [Sphaerochaeta sp. S2]|uniref:helix-turn-helix domain-containing protein n=1 Tax=Sphaerochaeta sp. S2 TaxID=2798868 RepID=UPI0018E9B1D4|nr:helix-turn-helix domain-containing protein [Sphaerochaeta sp. S2]MBJ2355602.1 transposase [Sphaerochaeta sp. S2]
MGRPKGGKNRKWTIQEKNRIVEAYLSGEIGWNETLRLNKITSHRTLEVWLKQYREKGTTYDNRGRRSKGSRRPIKFKLDFESMSREELIEYAKTIDDIKKFLAYQKKLKKNM